jgi:hypothetical protein
MILSPLAQALRWPLLEPAMRLAIWLQPLAWLSAWQSYLSGSAHLANRIGFSSQVTRSQLEHTTLLATRNPPGAQAKGNLAMFRWDATGALQALSVPAADHRRRSVTWSPSARPANPGRRRARSQLVVVPKANHMGFLEQAGDYNRHIAAFCDRVLAEARRSPRPRPQPAELSLPELETTGPTPDAQPRPRTTLSYQPTIDEAFDENGASIKPLGSDPRRDLFAPPH